MLVPPGEGRGSGRDLLEGSTVPVGAAAVRTREHHPSPAVWQPPCVTPRVPGTQGGTVTGTRTGTGEQPQPQAPGTAGQAARPGHFWLFTTSTTAQEGFSAVDIY